MKIIRLYMIAVCIMMIGSWLWKPPDLWILIYIFVFMFLDVSREIIEAINKKK